MVNPLEPIIAQLLMHIDPHASREELALTPTRVAEAMGFLTQGYLESLESISKDGIFKSPSHGMVTQKNIEFYSLCEHHLLPFYGKVHISYIPNEHMIGLSIMGKLVDMYARRLQVQERLTQQIAEGMQSLLSPKGVWVEVEAFHLCMSMTREGKQHCSTLTRFELGAKPSPL